MTILELATDLDLPRSGELWHQLRTGNIPADLVKSLSIDLVDLITKMLEPDHLKRPKIDDLLKTSKVNYLILSKNKNAYFYLYSMYHKWNSFLLTLWHFIVKPLQSFNSIMSNKNLNANHESDIKDQISSTPTRPSNYISSGFTPKASINDQFDFDRLDRNDSFNDTLSTNYSYWKALDDSSSFGELSGFSNHNKSYELRLSARKPPKTEPPKKAIKPGYLNIDSNYPKSSSPCKTPPWRPMSSFYSHNNNDNTPNGFTRQKLVFDEYDDLPRDSYRSLTPSPSDNNLGALKMKNQFYRELSASPASIGDEDTSSSSTEQISVKLKVFNY